MMIHLLKIPLLKPIRISDLLLGTHNLSVRGQKNVCKELLGTLEAIVKPIEGKGNLSAHLNALFLS